METQIDFELLQELIDCAKREVKKRYAVYPRLVEKGTMTNDEALKEQRLMYAIQKALQKIYDGTAPIPVQQSFLNAQEYIKGNWHG